MSSNATVAQVVRGQALLADVAALATVLLFVRSLFDADGQLVVPGMGFLDADSYDRAAGAALAAVAAEKDRAGVVLAMARELYAGFDGLRFQDVYLAETDNLLDYLQTFA